MSILNVEDIHKSFGKTKVLEGVSFSMEEGEVISIIGSSGSGKTTLLRCIGFLETADSGSVKVDGNVIFDAENYKILTRKVERDKLLNKLCS